MSIKILCVDDEENVLAGLQRNLRKRFQLDLAVGGPAGLERLERDGPYAVVVADMQMPVLNGIELLKTVRSRYPDTTRVMLTGNADQKTAVEAVNQGHIFRFLNKPCDPEVMTITLEEALRQHHITLAERELLQNTLNGAIKSLMEILAALDSRAFGIGQRLRDYVRALAVGFPSVQAWELELAAMLAPIGRVTVPLPVLLKERGGIALTSPEQDMIARVPEVGARLLENIPRLQNAAQMVRFQLKNFDGTGFPQQNSCAGEEIPIGARILHVLSDLLELEERGLSKAVALLQMKSRKGMYDTSVLAATCQCFGITGDDISSRIAERAVKVTELIPGQILAKDLKGKDGVLILAAGNKLTPFLIERIRNFQLIETISEQIIVSAPF
ncbi:MAG: response regulator [Verrucomicrobiales bacterium]|nr:response regulator [Verrucomicrobiales bacterium]